MIYRLIKSCYLNIASRKIYLVSVSLILVTISMFTFMHISEAHVGNGQENLYRVYIDNKFVGYVTDKDKVQQAINEEIEKTNINSNKVTTNQEISCKEEFNFSQEYDEAKTLEKIKEQVTFSVNALEVTIGDKLFGYLSKETEVALAIERFIYEQTGIKGKYSIPNSSLEITNQDANKTNVSIIQSVKLTKIVKLNKVNVSPDVLISANDLYEKISHRNLVEEDYTIKSGDVLGKIASKYNMNIEEILKLNPSISIDDYLKIGDKLTVLKPKTYSSVTIKKRETRKENIPFQVEIQEDSDMYVGETKTLQKGENGLKEVEYAITIEEDKVINKVILNNRVIKPAKKKIVKKGIKVVQWRGTGDFIKPTIGGKITSNYGQRWGTLHKGLDISGVSDRTIRSADNGKVIFAGWAGGYGKRIVINHNNGYKTTYNHLASINVKVGQVIPKGKKIGVMGSTGDSTGVHTHFEVYKNGNIVNPSNFVNY